LKHTDLQHGEHNLALLKRFKNLTYLPSFLDSGLYITIRYDSQKYNWRNYSYDNRISHRL